MSVTIKYDIIGFNHELVVTKKSIPRTNEFIQILYQDLSQFKDEKIRRKLKKYLFQMPLEHQQELIQENTEIDFSFEVFKVTYLTDESVRLLLNPSSYEIKS